MGNENPTHSKAALIAAAMMLLMVGCGELSTEYGSTKGWRGQSSLNGFGAFRTTFEKSGYRTRDVSRLTDRVRLSDVIVWTPQTPDAIQNEVTKWFDRWLKSGNKTLVYIVPDSGSEADYWIEAGKLAPASQRIEYRKRAARSVNQRMMWRLNRQDTPSNGWFQIEAQKHQTTIDHVTGPWAQSLLGDDETEPRYSTEFLIASYESDDVTSKKLPNANSTSAKSTGTPAPPVPAASPPPAPSTTPGPTGPGAPGVSAFGKASDVTATKTKIRFTSVVADESGNSIVATVHSPQWKGSEIIVVAGGSMLTNFALAHRSNQRLAAKIVEDSAPAPTANGRAPTAGFLTSDSTGVSVSALKPGVPVATGMELLTVWPLSLVTMHGVLLGLVLCLMLWPILGRPKRAKLGEHTHFGDHLDAVAGLMNRAGGEDYARRRISEYFKQIHGETAGPWVINQSTERRESAPALPPPKIGRKSVGQTVDADLPAPSPLTTPVVAPDKEIS